MTVCLSCRGSLTHLRYPCDFGLLTLPPVSTGGRSPPFDAYTGRSIWRGAYNKVDVIKIVLGLARQSRFSQVNRIDGRIVLVRAATLPF